MAAAKGEFKVTGWKEDTYAELASGKLTSADVTADLTGDIEGRATVRWLMCYRADGTADFVGFVDVEGTLAGREGGLVVTSVGTFDGKKAVGPWTIVEGSGRGELTGISGAGDFDSTHGGTNTYDLDYELG